MCTIAAAIAMLRVMYSRACLVTSIPHNEEKKKECSDSTRTKPQEPLECTV